MPSISRRLRAGWPCDFVACVSFNHKIAAFRARLGAGKIFQVFVIYMFFCLKWHLAYCLQQPDYSRKLVTQTFS